MLVVLQVVHVPDNPLLCEVCEGVAVVSALVTASADRDLEQGCHRVMRGQVVRCVQGAEREDA